MAHVVELLHNKCEALSSNQTKHTHTHPWPREAKGPPILCALSHVFGGLPSSRVHAFFQVPQRHCWS
jgi:hypothetical protein